MTKTIYNSPIQSQFSAKQLLKMAQLAHAYGANADKIMGITAEYEEGADVVVNLVKKPLGMSGLQLVKQILTDDEDKALLDAFTNAGGVVMLSATEFKFVLNGAYKTTPTTVAHLTSINAGGASEIVLHEYASKFAAAMAEVMDAQDDAQDKVPVASTIAKLPPLNEPVTPVALDVQTGVVKTMTVWETFPVDKMEKAVRIPLYQADKLYQPIKGTSSNSRYYLVAGNEELKVAARYMSGQLSVRIEGPQFNKHVTRINEVGFDAKPGDKTPYASLHLSVNNDMIAAKALGAIIMGLGIKLRTALPDINVLKGK